MFLLSGCWDQKELNDIVLIDGVGIDKAKDGKVEVTVSMVIPQAQSGGGRGVGEEEKELVAHILVVVRYATGVTVAKAHGAIANTNSTENIPWTSPSDCHK